MNWSITWSKSKRKKWQREKSNKKNKWKFDAKNNICELYVGNKVWVYILYYIKETEYHVIKFLSTLF